MTSLEQELARVTRERNELKSRLDHAEADAEQAVHHLTVERDEARSELARLRPFVEVVRSFLRSGYDGEFIGPGVAPLFNALAELERAEERDEARVLLVANQAVYHAELQRARKALAAVVAMLESCNDRIVPIGWDRTAWEGFCLHRYNAADDVRAMKPEDILTER
jgi:hypothetical protein